MLTVLRPHVSICTVAIDGYATPYLWSFLRQLPADQQDFTIGLFEMSEGGSKSLYKDVVVRDREKKSLRIPMPSPFSFKRIVFLLDTTQSLPCYDFQLDCTRAITTIHASIALREGKYTTDTEVRDERDVIWTFRSFLIEAWLWHLWVRCVYDLKEKFLEDLEVNYRQGAVRLVRTA